MSNEHSPSPAEAGRKTTNSDSSPEQQQQQQQEQGQQQQKHQQSGGNDHSHSPPAEADKAASKEKPSATAAPATASSSSSSSSSSSPSSQTETNDPKAASVSPAKDGGEVKGKTATTATTTNKKKNKKKNKNSSSSSNNNMGKTAADTEESAVPQTPRGVRSASPSSSSWPPPPPPPQAHQEKIGRDKKAGGRVGGASPSLSSSSSPSSHSAVTGKTQQQENNHQSGGRIDARGGGGGGAATAAGGEGANGSDADGGSYTTLGVALLIGALVVYLVFTRVLGFNIIGIGGAGGSGGGGVSAGDHNRRMESLLKQETTSLKNNVDKNGNVVLLLGLKNAGKSCIFAQLTHPTAHHGSDSSNNNNNNNNSDTPPPQLPSTHVSMEENVGKIDGSFYAVYLCGGNKHKNNNNNSNNQDQEGGEGDGDNARAIADKLRSYDVVDFPGHRRLLHTRNLFSYLSYCSVLVITMDSVTINNNSANINVSSGGGGGGGGGVGGGSGGGGGGNDGAAALAGLLLSILQSPQAFGANKNRSRHNRHRCLRHILLVATKRDDITSYTARSCRKILEEQVKNSLLSRQYNEHSLGSVSEIKDARNQVINRVGTTAAGGRGVGGGSSSSGGNGGARGVPSLMEVNEETGKFTFEEWIDNTNFYCKNTDERHKVTVSFLDVSAAAATPSSSASSFSILPIVKFLAECE